MKPIEAYKTEDGEIFATQQEAELHERRTCCLKLYQVDFSYDGYASVEVLAKNEDDAIETAKDQIIYNYDICFELADVKAKLIGN